MTLAWLYLFIASMLEIAWTLTMKNTKFAFWKWKRREVPVNLLYFLGYIVFGISNVTFLTLALKEIPTAMGITIWMGTAVTGIAIVDFVYYREPVSFQRVFFLALTLAGIVGLKLSGDVPMAGH